MKLTLKIIIVRINLDLVVTELQVYKEYLYFTSLLENKNFVESRFVKHI